MRPNTSLASLLAALLSLLSFTTFLSHLAVAFPVDSPPTNGASLIENRLISSIPIKRAASTVDVRTSDHPEAEPEAILYNVTTDGQIEERALVRRGCTLTQPMFGNPRYVCDGAIPTTEEIRGEIRRRGAVGAGISSIFYTNLGGAGGLQAARNWIIDNPGAIPCPFVMFTGVVEMDYNIAVHGSLSSSSANVDTYQKLVSQVFAEESAGNVYLFTPWNEDPLTIQPPNGPTAWRGWEYPALTRNPNVNQIISLDPREHIQMFPALQRRVIWDRAIGNGPSPNPPLGANRNPVDWWNTP